MSWRLSRFRSNDLAEVRSKEEILATLDEYGCADGMPFMPEMLKFCGQRIRVSAVAHKTCDTVRKTKTRGRRLQRTVHLTGARCDGSAHGACQAECNLFWKDVWLKPTSDNRRGSARPADGAPETPSGGCTETELLANTHLPSDAEADEPRYSCQATKLYEATQPLPFWDVRQYVFDAVTGNRTASEVLRVVWLASLRTFLRNAPFGWRLINSFNEWMHRLLTGRASPHLSGKVGRGQKTPTGRLVLKPGEYVRIKSQEDIENTLDRTGKNRGLSFDPEEMAPYCGRVFKVRSSVTKIIDESTGKMLHMKQPCIILDGVVCNAEKAPCRLNCPRAIPSYWREIWLERVKEGDESNDVSVAPRVKGSPYDLHRDTGGEPSRIAPRASIVSRLRNAPRWQSRERDAAVPAQANSSLPSDG
jgi:hypothetical protein